MHMSFLQRVRFWVNNGQWRKLVLAAALPTWFALSATQALAASVGGQDTNVNIGLGACTTLNQQIIPASPQVRYCAATGSADVSNPGNVGLSSYAFNLTLDNAACAPLDGGAERTVQFGNLANVPDVRIKEVSSTRFFVIPAGNFVHVIRWTGRIVPGSPATVVLDRSMTVVCDFLPLPVTPIPGA